MNMKKMLLGALGMAMATSAMAVTSPLPGTATAPVSGNIIVGTMPSDDISLELKNGGFVFEDMNLQQGEERTVSKVGATVKQGQETLTAGYYFKLADKSTVEWGLSNMITAEAKAWWSEAGTGADSYAAIITDNAGTQSETYGKATLTDNAGDLNLEVQVYNTLTEGSYTLNGEVWVALPDAFGR